MANDVGEAFLDDAENRRFHVALQAAEIFGQVQINGNLAAFREPVDIPAQSRLQSGFVEKRRVKQV